MRLSCSRVGVVQKRFSQGRCTEYCDDVLRCGLWLLDTRWKTARGDATLLDPHVRPLRKISHGAREVCVQDLTIVWLVVERGGKFLHGAMGYIRGGEVGELGKHQHQAIIKSTTTLQSSTSILPNSLIHPESSNPDEQPPK
jgi:hypothetical protein